MNATDLVPANADSALALSVLEIASDLTLLEQDSDTLLFIGSGSGTVTLGEEDHRLGRGSAALVLEGEEATVSAGAEGLSAIKVTVGQQADRHAPLGPREPVVALDSAASESATGSRSYQVLFGPGNGSTRATLFAGYLPPGRAPWHFHLYDEIVWVPEGTGRLHLGDRVDELGPGSAFRLRPRQVHIVENASPDRDLMVVGIFTPAGSPSAAYLAP